MVTGDIIWFDLMVALVAITIVMTNTGLRPRDAWRTINLLAILMNMMIYTIVADAVILIYFAWADYITTKLKEIYL